MAQCGQFLAHRFKHSGLGINKVVAPRSGVILAQAVALNLQIPMIVAVTKAPMTSSPDGIVHSKSRSAGGVYEDDQTLYLSAEFVCPGDKVLVIDDVLASGKMAAAVVELVKACGATVAGCGCAARSDQHACMWPRVPPASPWAPGNLNASSCSRPTRVTASSSRRATVTAAPR